MPIPLEPQETDLVAAARALGPLIRDHRGEMDRTRTIPPPVVTALAAAGIYQMYVPAELGGLGVRPFAYIESVIAIAAADGSVGWNAGICGVQGVYLSRLDERVARKILASDGHGIAGSLSPAPAATIASGGYNLRGRWGFASGSDQATWLMAPGVLFDDAGVLRNEAGIARTRVMLLPKSEATMLDTWHTAGMRATGSHDFTVENAFIPEGYTFDTQVPGRYSGAIHRLPVLTAFGPGVASISLGIARGAIDELIRLAAEKRPTLSAGVLRERPAVQLQVAEAEALYQSAKAFLIQAVGKVYASAEANVPPSIELRTQQRLAAWNATRSALRATELCFDAAGTTAIYETSPLERALRDVRVAAQHVVAGAAAHEAAGKALLGLEAGPLI